MYHNFDRKDVCSAITNRLNDSGGEFAMGRNLQLSRETENLAYICSRIERLDHKLLDRRS